MKKGFTLMELLVVVLIIGILTASALPMYEKAQRKARFTEVQTVAKTLMNAVDIYAMGNGYLAEQNYLIGNSPYLDIDYPWLSCVDSYCTTQVGKWFVFSYNYGYTVAFVPDKRYLTHSGGDSNRYVFSKQRDKTWILSGSLAYDSTYQMFCDWWVKGGGNTDSGFAGRCK